jgi:hypothetical protein
MISIVTNHERTSPTASRPYDQEDDRTTWTRTHERREAHAREDA